MKSPPKILREKLVILQHHGFELLDFKRASGSHFKVWFKGIDGFVVITSNNGDIRSVRNLLAYLRRNRKEPS